MELVKTEEINKEAQFNKAAELIESILTELHKIEFERLKQCFMRACLLKGIGLLGDISKVECRQFPSNKNYRKYYYTFDGKQFLLMDRLLVVEDGIPTLKINTNPQLD